MDWPVILSGMISFAALTLGFDMFLPLGSDLEPLCVLTGVASAMVFFGLVEGPKRGEEAPCWRAPDPRS